jgi:uridine phosphorylase
MGYPKYPAKHSEAAYISREQVLAQLRAGTGAEQSVLPEAVVICYQKMLWDAVCADSAGTAQSVVGMRTLAAMSHSVGVVGGFGIGAPAACVVMEGLIAFGIRRFVSVGLAGSLQPDIQIGEVVLCDKAIRDEGTSYHYLPASRYAAASPELTARLRNALKQRGVAYRLGTSWTIDAPYRETVAEIRQYRCEGIATVDMEAAALFAVAEYRGVEVGALFTISDSLAGDEWRHSFRGPEVRAGLQTLYQVALDSLAAGSQCSSPSPLSQFWRRPTGAGHA